MREKLRKGLSEEDGRRLSGGKKGNVGGFGVEGFWITREKVVFWG